MLKNCLINWGQYTVYHYNTKHNLVETKKAIYKILEYSKEFYGFYIFMTIYTFLEEGKFKQSLNYCQEAKKYAKGDGLWLYNRAFILMYDGDFNRGLSDYHEIKNNSFPMEEEIVLSCILNDEKLYVVHPEKIQICYILGFLYYHKLNNLPQALKYFEEFIALSNGREIYDVLRNSACDFLQPIKNELGIE